jgi:hypothetical protein
MFVTSGLILLYLKGAEEVYHENKILLGHIYDCFIGYFVSGSAKGIYNTGFHVFRLQQSKKDSIF